MNAENRKTKKTRYKLGNGDLSVGEFSSCINTVMPIKKLKGFLSLNQSINQWK